MTNRPRCLVSVRAWFLASGIAAASLAGACAATTSGAPDTTLSAAKGKSPNGARLYALECAGCHGDRGQGAAGSPPVMGTGALPVYPRDSSTSSPTVTDPQQLQTMSQTRPPGVMSRDPFRNAQDLYNYVSTKMPLPKSKAGSLKPDEYWAIVDFMLRAHGAKVPDAGVTPANASSISL